MSFPVWPICLVSPTLSNDSDFITYKFLNNRRYTKFYGTLGDSAARIAHDAILGNVSMKHLGFFSFFFSLLKTTNQG